MDCCMCFESCLEAIASHAYISLFKNNNKRSYSEFVTSVDICSGLQDSVNIHGKTKLPSLNPPMHLLLNYEQR